jgi:hypothetical protein
MPFVSQAQRRFMHARHPEIADRWEEHTPKGKRLPKKKGSARKSLFAITMAKAADIPQASGASGMGGQNSALPDFESIYMQPEAKKRQDKEAEQARDRRRSMWRDYNFAGLHGRPLGDKPALRFDVYDTSTADNVTRPNRNYLTPKEIKAQQKRITGGLLDYGDAVGTAPKKRGS